MTLRATYRQAQASRYLRPDGAWDVPTLDQLLSPPVPSAAPAIVDGDVQVDAAGLEQQVAALSGGLRRAGVRRGSVVAWQLPNWWEAIALFRACWRCAAVAAPIHHQVGAAIRQAGPQDVAMAQLAGGEAGVGDVAAGDVEHLAG